MKPQCKTHSLCTYKCEVCKSTCPEDPGCLIILPSCSTPPFHCPFESGDGSASFTLISETFLSVEKTIQTINEVEGRRGEDDAYMAGFYQQTTLTLIETIKELLYGKENN